MPKRPRGTARILPKTGRKTRVDDLVHDMITWYCTVKLRPVFASVQEAKWKQHLESFFGGLHADQVGTDQWRQYRIQRMADPNPPSPTTINRELQVLRKAYKLGAAAGKIKVLPTFEMATENNARKVFITESDKQRLRDAASKDTAKPTARMKGMSDRIIGGETWAGDGA